jgi:hypothetical protein
VTIENQILFKIKKITFSKLQSTAINSAEEKQKKNNNFRLVLTVSKSHAVRNVLKPLKKAVLPEN